MKKILAFTMIFSMISGLFICSNYPRTNVKASEESPYSSFFTFDGNVDNAGSSQLNGTGVGSPAFVPGHSGETGDQAISFNGTNYVKVDASVFKPGESFTVGYWMMMPETDVIYNSAQRIISTGVWGDWTQGFATGVFNFKNDTEQWSKIITGIGSPAPSFTWCEAYPLMNDGQWRHVACSFDGINKRVVVYLDGVEAANYDYPAGGGAVTPYLETAIGGMLSGGAFFEGYGGALDDLAVIPSVLTAEQVVQLKNGTYGVQAEPSITPEPTITEEPAVTAQPSVTAEPEEESKYSSYFTFNGDVDNTGFSKLNGTMVGSPLFVTGHSGKTGDQAISFNGTNYVKVAASAFAPGESFSIGFWMMMPESDEIYNAAQRILSTGLWGDGLPGMAVGVFSFKNRVEEWSKLVTGIGCAAPSFNWSEADTLWNDGKWRHVACVFDGANKHVTAYINGIEASSYDYPSDGSTATPYTETAIGGMLSGGTFFEGYGGVLDELAVVPSTLTAVQVLQLKAGTLFTTTGETSDSSSESTISDDSTQTNDTDMDSTDEIPTTGDNNMAYLFICTAALALAVTAWGCLKLKGKISAK